MYRIRESDVIIIKGICYEVQCQTCLDKVRDICNLLVSAGQLFKGSIFWQKFVKRENGHHFSFLSRTLWILVTSLHHLNMNECQVLSGYCFSPLGKKIKSVRNKMTRTDHQTAWFNYPLGIFLSWHCCNRVDLFKHFLNFFPL